MRTKFMLLAICLGCFISSSRANDYFWVNGSGNWSDHANHWATSSGGGSFHSQVPTPADNVYFDANSFSAPGQSVTVDVTIVQCLNMSWAGVTHSPTLSIPFGNALRVFGSLQFVTGMNTNINGSVSFNATSPGKTIASAGHEFYYVTFNGIGGVWTLADTFGAQGYIDLLHGTLNSSGQTVNTVHFTSTSGSGAILNMGASTFNVRGIWECRASSVTVNPGGSTINMTNPFGGNTYFYGGSLNYHNLHFTGTAATALILWENNFSGTVSFAGDGMIGNTAYVGGVGSNQFNNIVFAAGHTYQFVSGFTQTLNGTLTANGNCGQFINLQSTVAGSPAYINKASGPVSLSYVTLKDLVANGGAAFSASNSIDLGNNGGWSITAPPVKNLYWVGNSGNWNDGNHWSLSSGGPASGCAPTPVDNVFFNAASFSLPGQTVSITDPSVACNSMNWSGVTNGPTLDLPFSSTLRIFGSLQFAPGMTAALAGFTRFEGNTSGKTILSAGKSFSYVTFNAIGGGWSLADAFTAQYFIDLVNGALNTNGQTVNATHFTATTGNNASLILGNSVVNINGIWEFRPSTVTVNAGTSTINMTSPYNSNVYFYGGNHTYHNLNFTGTSGTGVILWNNTFTGTVSFAGDGNLGNPNYVGGTGNNSFNHLVLAPGHTYTLANGYTQTVTGTVTANGTCSNLINIRSLVNGSPAYISRASGTLAVTYANLKDVWAVGGAIFNATNSFDLGNVNGWTLTAPAPRTLYWVGNGGNWEDGNHWSLSSGGPAAGCAPTPVDDVVFDGASFTIAGQTVGITSANAYCRNMDWMAAGNGPSFDLPFGSTLHLYGGLAWPAGITTSFNGFTRFEASGAANGIRTSGHHLSYVTFEGNAGEWTLQDAFTADYFIDLLKGTLHTNGQTVNTNHFTSVNGSNAILDLGTSTVNVNGTWDFRPLSVTVLAGTSTINMTNPFGFNVYFSGGDQTYHNLNFTAPNSTGFILFQNTFTGKVSFAGDGFIGSAPQTGGMVNTTVHDLQFSPGHTYTLVSNYTLTITGDLLAFGTPGFPIRIKGETPGLPAIIFKSTGNVCLDYIRISDLAATGGAFFNAGLAPDRSFDLGGNTGWVFTGSNNIFYRDADGDGFGDPGITAQTCTPPPGYIADNTDCNDANSAIYPGAPELCDQLDNDCDGLIDEDGSLTIEAGDDAQLYFGYPPTQCLIRTVSLTGTAANIHYSWTLSRPLLPGESMSGASSETVTVCLRANAQLCVTVTFGNGCTVTDCFQVFATDITCSAGNSNNVKVLVCHKGHTICVSKNAVPAHLAHPGDYLGPCHTGKGEFPSPEPEVLNILTVYPNPSRGSLTVTVVLDELRVNTAQVQLLTLNGVIVKQQLVCNGQSLQIQVAESGIYLVRLQAGDRVITKKVIVAR